MSRTLLVFGWYGKNNCGDELMKRALIELFTPRNIVLRFVDYIDGNALKGTSGIIFGGGSILHNDPHVSPGALNLLLARKYPVCYVGVGLGSEAEPSQVHQQLLRVAAFTVFRDRDMLDLVYSLTVPTATLSQPPTGVLWLTNVEVLPTHASPHWMHVAWERFKDESAQCIDQLVDDHGLHIDFGLMCRNDRQDDAWPAHELTGRTLRRPPKQLLHRLSDLEGAVALMRRHRVVVTQRYHGIVLSEIAGVPYVSVAHHDKLNDAMPHRGTYLSYHGINKRQLVSAIECQALSSLSPYTVDRWVYDRLVERVVEMIGGS